MPGMHPWPRSSSAKELLEQEALEAGKSASTASGETEEKVVEEDAQATLSTKMIKSSPWASTAAIGFSRALCDG